MTVAGLNALFAAVHDIFAFLDFNYISRAKLAAVVAAITWYVNHKFIYIFSYVYDQPADSENGCLYADTIVKP
jgi:hypothetical protein